jgi:hypothetical protein
MYEVVSVHPKGEGMLLSGESSGSKSSIDEILEVADACSLSSDMIVRLP